MRIIQEFKEFAARGNVVDLAVGLIMGAAFGKVVSSLVSDMLMPPIGRIMGNIDFSNLFVNLSDKPAASLAEAKSLGLATINYGLFLNTLIDFFIVSLAVFFLVKVVNRLRAAPKAAPSTKECPYCRSAIPLAAVKCGHCTSDLPG